KPTGRRQGASYQGGARRRGGGFASFGFTPLFSARLYFLSAHLYFLKVRGQKRDGSRELARFFGKSRSGRKLGVDLRVTRYGLKGNRQGRQERQGDAGRS